MKNMAAVTKRDGKAIVVRGAGIGLVFDGGFIERIAADGAGVGADIPGPHCHWNHES